MLLGVENRHFRAVRDKWSLYQDCGREKWNEKAPNESFKAGELG